MEKDANVEEGSGEKSNTMGTWAWNWCWNKRHKRQENLEEGVKSARGLLGNTRVSKTCSPM